jgi:hypothetical protein
MLRQRRADPRPRPDLLPRARDRPPAETRSGATWRTIRAELGQIRQGHFRSTDGDFRQTSELTLRQRDLHAQLGIPEPPRFGRITPTAMPTQA